MKKIPSIFLAVAFLSVYFFLFPELLWNPDSYSYLRFSEWLSSGTYEGDLVPFYLVIRTPGYPFLLYLGSKLAAFPDSIRLIHSLLGVAALASVYLSFRKHLRPFYIFFSIAASFLLMREYFLTIMTEWSAFCFLVISFCLLFQFLKTRNYFVALFLGVSVGALILIRPPLIAACVPLLFLLLMGVIEVRQFTWMMLGAALLYIPWSVYKYDRLDNGSFTDFGGYNLAGIAMTLGEAEILDRDDSDFAHTYYYHLNSNRLPPRSEDLRSATAEDLDLWVAANTWDSAFSYIYDQGTSIKEGNKLAAKYARRIILDNPGNYFWFLFQQFKRYLWSLPLMLFAIWAALRVRFKSRDSAFYHLTISAIILDINYFLISSLFTRYIDRFQILTASVLLLITLLALLSSHQKAKTHSAL